MSTILDALRKVEVDQRVRSADARARLLSFPSRSPASRLRRQRLPWFICTGLVLAGFASGVTLVRWKSHIRAAAPPEPVTQAGLSLALPPAVASSPHRPPEGEQELVADGAPEVQRSPFAAIAPAPVEMEFPTASEPPSAPPPPLPEAGKDLSVLPVITPDPAAYETPENIQPESGLPPAPVSEPAGSSLSFLQWSPDPNNRIAFIKIDGGPLTLVHEGDTVGGFLVVEIHQDAVDLRSQDRSFTLHLPQ